MKEQINFECSLDNDILRGRKKILFEICDYIEGDLNMIVEIIYIHISVSFKFTLIRSVYNFGVLI